MSEETPEPGAEETAEYDAPNQRVKNLWGSTKQLGARLGPERRPLGVVVALIITSVVLSVLAPRILGQAVDVIYSGFIGGRLPAGADLQTLIDQANAEGNTDYAEMLAKSGVTPGVGIDFGLLGQKIGILIAMYVGAALFQWWSGYLLNLLVMRVVYRLREDIETKINTLPLAFFDSRQRGDIMSRVTNDVDNVQNALQQGFSQALNSLLRVVGIAAMMFILSWRLALIALIALPLTALVAGLLGSKSRNKFTEQWRETGRLNGHIEETFSGLELVRIFGRSEDMMAEFDERNDALYRSAFTAQFLSGSIMPLMQFVSFLSYVLIAVAGALRVASGNITLGDATAFIQYSREFSQPLSQLGGLANMVLSGLASSERCFELLDAEEQIPDRPTSQLPDHTDGHVEFDDVSFSYRPDTPLIENLSLAVSPGETVAIVGPTGAGKTTLVNLIMRFYDLDSGRILIDGIDTATLTRQQVRSRVGMVLQDAVLFEDTIAANIRYGRLEATDEEVVAAAEATMVDRFVRQLPEGYDTVIEPDAQNLSAGERQLLTIARAHIADPSLLILDEATSSVDTRTELLVQQAMNELRSGRTSFVIAHRLSTIRDADLILMMEDGRIVESGNHEELLAAKGAYYRLYMSQFEGAQV